MRTFIKNSFIIIVIAILVLQVISYLLSKPSKTQYTDSELRDKIISRSMLSTPNTYDELLIKLDSQNNRLSKEKIELGKSLFFNKILSKNKNTSCDTCHVIDKDITNNRSNKQFSKMLLSKEQENANDCVVCHLSDQSATDRLATAIGDDNKQNPFHLNTLTILNSALAKYQTWDGSVDSVEEQAGASITDKYQMNLTADEAVQRLSLDRNYVKKFNKVFEDKTITFENLKKALGAYVKTLITYSDYDKFVDGDNNAINEKAKRGITNFINFGCSGCHGGITMGGQSIQKFPLRDYNSFIDLTNTFAQDKKGREATQIGLNFEMRHFYPFENTGEFLGKNNQQLFKVPILRNITKTSPYFHNGTINKLRDAIRLMAKHQLGMSPTDEQVDEIEVFFKSLEGDIVDYKILNEDQL